MVWDDSIIANGFAVAVFYLERLLFTFMQENFTYNAFKMHLVHIQLVLIKRTLMHVAYLSEIMYFFPISTRHNAQIASNSKVGKKVKIKLLLRMSLVVLGNFFLP